jgi:hypothetical protein
MTEVHLTRFRGNTFVLPITIYEEDGQTPVNITGSRIKFTLGSITESSPGVAVAINGANGSITVTVPASLMAALKEATYDFDVQVTYADLTVETLSVGVLNLMDTVTA